MIILITIIIAVINMTMIIVIITPMIKTTSIKLFFAVPQVVRICTQFIEEHGIVNGIYRASGISSNIQRIK